jgi:uncharacterized membrane protein
MEKTQRYWEIDVIRGAAFLMMFVLHSMIVRNLVFKGEPTAPASGEAIGKTGALLFLVLVGVSGYISYSFKVKDHTFFSVAISFLKRGLVLLAWGFVITLVSYSVVPFAPILFGVLSLIGICVIFLPFFIKHKLLSWLFIFTAPVIGYAASTFHLSSIVLLGIGIYQQNLETLDYWPLFPWISIPLIGVELGRLVYLHGQRKIQLPKIDNWLMTGLTWIGSHSLALYLLHVPMLYILFSCIMYFNNV